MFPTLAASMSALTPEIYFGGHEVPQYYRRKRTAEPTPEEAEDEIRLVSMGRECTGYIDPDGIYLHIYEDDEDLHVDMSRDFIFIACPEVSLKTVPSAWHVLRFLQEPARRGLWVTKTTAVYLEKTERTMALCKELDALWQEDPFLPIAQDAVMHVDAEDLLLPVLMRRYEERTIGTATEQWQFYHTFGPLLMKERLFLSTQVIPPESYKRRST